MAEMAGQRHGWSDRGLCGRTDYRALSFRVFARNPSIPSDTRGVRARPVLSRGGCMVGRIERPGVR